MPMLPEPLGQLADRRRLARAVDADHEQDARTTAAVESRRVAEEARDPLCQRGVEIDGVGTSLEPSHELGRRGDADVRTDQRFLEPLPRVGVAWIERRRRELGGESPPAPRERITKPREKSRTRPPGPSLRVLFSQELGPATRQSRPPAPGGGARERTSSTPPRPPA